MKFTFETIEKGCDFRVDFLFFLQLANNALANIFENYFSRRRFWAKKPETERRHRKSRKLYQAINDYVTRNKRKDLPKDIYRRIIVDGDVFQKRVWNIFGYLPEEDKIGLLDSLNEKYFTDYKRWNDFYKDWECLCEKRNYIIHYRQQQLRGKCFGINRPDHINDENVVKAMSKLLLNYLNEEFIKTVESHLKRQKILKESVEFVSELKRIVKRANKAKKEVKMKEAGSKLKGQTTRAERQRLQKIKEDLIRKKDRFYKESPSKLRLLKFKNFYHFVGKKNIKNLKAIFEDVADKNRLKFDDYRSLFDLSTRINLIIHRHLEDFKDVFVSKTNSRNDILSKLVKELPEYQDGRQKFLLSNLVNIRNGVEHNCPAYRCSKSNNTEIREMSEVEYKNHFENEILKDAFQENLDKNRCSFFEVIVYMMKAIDHYLSSQKLNDFYTQLLMTIEKEKYCLVKTGDNKVEKIKCWSEEKRKQYEASEVNKRDIIKKIAGKWHEDVRMARNFLKK